MKMVFSKIIRFTFLMSVLYLSVPSFYAFADIEKELLSGDDVMVVAHRACWQNAPENSLAAIENCIKLGVQMVELDVRRTRDGRLIVIHDSSVNRMTTGKGKVKYLTLAQIRALRLREGAGGESAPATNHIVPTLVEALLATRGRILVNLDAKEDVREQAFAIVAILEMEKEILMKSTLAAKESKLKRAKYIGRTHYMPVIVEGNKSLSRVVKSFDAYKPVAYEIVYRNDKFFMEGIPAMKKRGAHIWVNTLKPGLAGSHYDRVALENPDKHWGGLIRAGVTMIQTDYPAKLINYLQLRGR